MDKIAEKIDVLNAFNNELKTYLTRLKPLIENIYKSEVSSVKVMLAQYEDTLHDIPRNIDTIENMLHTMNNLNILDIYIMDIYSAFSQFNVHSVEYSTHMSRSYILETELILRDLEKKYIAFNSGNMRLNIDIVNILTDKILDNKHLDELHAYFEKYPHSIHLYARAMQKMLDKGYAKNTILEMLEKAKTTILSMTECDEYIKKPPEFSINPPICTFGMFPICRSEELCIILRETLGVECNSGSDIVEADLDSIGKKSKICIIVLRKIIKNPIEFNIWQLLDRNIAAKYEQPADMGITQKTIDKCNTISMSSLGNDKKAKCGWDFNPISYGLDRDAADMFLILDTLNMYTYRVISIWKSPLNKAMLPKYRIRAFLEFYFDHNPRDKLDAYNKIMIKKAQDAMFLNSLIDIDKLEKYSIYESKYLRHAIFNEIKLVFNKLIELAPITNNIAFSKIVHDDAIFDAFYDVIMNYYNEYIGINKSLLERVHFPYSEILVTFLTFLKNLTIEFKKEMHAQYVKLEPENKIFSTSMVKSIIVRIFDNILTNTLATIITDESNIYQSALRKYQLLSLV